ncbi:MAG: FAD-dependent oxidoreductase [Chitinivibrionales bacterium]
MRLSAVEQSFWLQTASFDSFDPLETDLRVDTVVVGSGITGLSTALFLKWAGMRVAVIDRNQMRGGMSVKHDGSLSLLTDIPYSTIIRRIGLAKTRRLVKGLYAAQERIEGVIRELSIHCSFMRFPDYHLASGRGDARQLEQQRQIAEDIGIDVRFVCDTHHPVKNMGGIVVDNQPMFNPAHYIHALVSSVAGQGSIVHAHTPAIDIHDGSPARVVTKEREIWADNIVLATNTPPGINILQTLVEPQLSYLMAAKLYGELPRGLFNVVQEDTTIRFRYEQQGENQLLVFHGYEHATGKGDPVVAAQKLETFVREHFNISEVMARWRAESFRSLDTLPFIGQAPRSKHVWVASGLGKDTPLWGTFAAMIISDGVLGRNNPYADLVDAHRIPIPHFNTITKKNVDYAKTAIVDRFRQSRNQENNLDCGQGAVIHEYNRDLAVYRDEEGTFHRFEAFCPHMRCKVGWNAVEKTWDCPCHGSRFDAFGRPLEGPAVKGLKSFRVHPIDYPH